MKLLLPGGSGAGGIINWGGRVQKFIFLPGGSGAGGIFSWGGRVQNHFSDLKFFFEIQLKNHLCHKVSLVLKSLNRNLSDDILKLGKIKFKVFLNWISKKMSNLKNGFAPCHLSWKCLLHPYPLAKKFFCTLPPQLIMPPAPLPPGKKTQYYHNLSNFNTMEKRIL